MDFSSSSFGDLRGTESFQEVMFFRYFYIILSLNCSRFQGVVSITNQGVSLKIRLFCHELSIYLLKFPFVL